MNAHDLYSILSTFSISMLALALVWACIRLRIALRGPFLRGGHRG